MTRTIATITLFASIGYEHSANDNTTNNTNHDYTTNSLILLIILTFA